MNALLISVFLALFAHVRDALRRVLGDDAAFTSLHEHLVMGRFRDARRQLDVALNLYPSPLDDAARAAQGLLSALDVLVTNDLPRRFHGIVKLNGHFDLGVCRVEEERLAGVMLLRCTRLETSSARVHWVASRNLYDLEELTDAQAEERLAQKAKKRRADAEVCQDDPTDTDPDDPYDDDARPSDIPF